MALRVGATDMRVSALGRWVVSGNRGAHTVKLVDASTGADLPGASATVVTAGGPSDRFAYGNLTAPVALGANRAYYLVSEEVAGGDTWYDYDTRVQTTAAAADTGVVYAYPGAPTNWVPGGSAGMAYGPLSLLYGSGTVTTPTITTTTTTTT